MLGKEGGALHGYTGNNGLPILMANVQCAAGAAGLNSCTFDTTHTCNHFSDVGIDCVEPRKQGNSVAGRIAKTMANAA